MAEEMRFHIEQYTEDLVRSGVPPAEAARRARMEFGSVDNVKEDCREARGLRLFDELHQDLRYAVRLLRKTPGFTATALATLALCLGANLTIFAVVDSVLLRPLPFPDADRLVSVYNTYPKAGVDQRRLLADELLRAPGAHRRLLGARGLPRRHGDRRRNGRDGARTGHARLAGLLLHPGARPGDGARVSRRRRPFKGTTTRPSSRTATGGSASAPTRACSAARSASTASPGPWSGSCRPASASSRPRRGSTCRSRRARKSARPSSGIPGTLPHMIARLRPGATLAAGPGADRRPATPPWRWTARRRG